MRKKYYIHSIIALLISVFRLNSAELINIPKSAEYIDPSGDSISVLDYEQRINVAKAQKLKASHVYDDVNVIEKYKKEVESNALEKKQVQYGEYVVVSGDQFKKISKKIYGSTNRWKEILLLNETNLTSDKLPIGTKLKYIIDEKEISNDKQPGKEI
jgi:nucleoid-associated protein YgaU